MKHIFRIAFVIIFVISAGNIFAHEHIPHQIGVPRIQDDGQPYHDIITKLAPDTCKQTGLNGRVKQVAISEEVIESEKPSRILLSKIYYYDKHGRLVKEQTFDGQTSRPSILKYQYRKDGCVSRITIPFDYAYVFRRDNAGRIITVDHYRIEKGKLSLDIQDRYEYYQTGRIRSYTEAAHEAMFFMYYNFEYDSSGRLIYASIYDNRPEPNVTTHKYTYDNNKIIIDGYVVCQFDSNKKIVSRTCTLEDVIERSDYDKKGNLTKVTKTTGETQTVNIYEYDNHKNLLKITSSVDGKAFVTITEYKYKYDKKGNWTSRQSVIGNDPTVHRKIVYYQE